MSSRFKVEVSAAVKSLLSRQTRAEAREVALLLLRLEREPEPPGSRELEPLYIDPISGERVWERPDWTITYWVDRNENLIVVGRVRATARSLI